jgi:high-affinity nickel permease
MTTLSILFIGLLLGMQHATEADHLAAASPCLASSPPTAAK